MSRGASVRRWRGERPERHSCVDASPAPAMTAMSTDRITALVMGGLMAVIVLRVGRRRNAFNARSVARPSVAPDSPAPARFQRGSVAAILEPRRPIPGKASPKGGAAVQNGLVERLQALADTLDAAIDHIETLEAIVAEMERIHPEAVDRARACAAVARKDRAL